MKAFTSLRHQRVAVGQKEHPLHPVGALQHIAQGNHGPCLARAGGHHQQSFALLPLQSGGNFADGPFLVVAFDNRLVRRNRIERLVSGAAVDSQLQLVAGIEALHRPRWIERIIPQPMLVTVGVEDHRALAKLPLQAVGIELGLLLALPGVALGAFGFHHRQRLAILTPQDVIHKALAGVVRHPLHGKLAVPWLVERPASLLQQQVDEGVAGFGLVVIVGVGSGNICGLGGGHLGAQPLNLIVQRRLVFEQSGQALVFGRQRGCQFFQLLLRLRRNGRTLRQQSIVEGQLRRGPRTPRIAVRQPPGELEEFAAGRQRVVLGNHLLGVDGPVAMILDDPGLGGNALRGQCGKGGFGQQRGQVVLIGQRHSGFGLVEPLNRKLQRSPRIKARRARIGIDQRLRLRGRLINQRPFGLQEGEVAHALKFSSEGAVLEGEE